MRLKNIGKILFIMLMLVSLVCTSGCGEESDRDSDSSTRSDKDRKKDGEVTETSETSETDEDDFWGSIIVFEADTDEPVSKKDMEAVQAVLRTRLDSIGYLESTVKITKDNHIQVMLPGIDKPDKAHEVVGATARLTFRDAEGNVILEGGSDVVAAATRFGEIDSDGTQDYYVEIKFTKQGQRKFAEATAEISARTDGANYIAIFLDEAMISAPMVSDAIDSEDCIITGDFTKEQVEALAAQISSGQLPFSLKCVSTDVVSK